MPENMGADFFTRPDYASLIADGNGLNPLLENIWMAIHPPLLFLGYATVLVPFAYAFAGMVQKDFSGWLKPALPWVALAAFNLGVGIILGGAWAYIDLTFGGFWAWDPVENASLVPWLLTVATLHLMLLARVYKYNLRWAFIMSGLSYTMVVYASYLTRSGVLKDSSAHAFGEEGKAILLVIFTLFFLVLTLGGLFFFKPPKSERGKESLNSREFWMFVGSIILILSAFQIVITTSIPVINKLIGTNLAPPNDSVAYYNRWQLPYGILIILLVGMAHYMKYGKTDMKLYLKRIILPAVIAFVSIVLAMVITPFTNPLHYVFLFFIIYALYTAAEQLFSKNRLIRNTGAIISHLGLATFMLGILLAFSHENILTRANHPQMMNEGMSSNQILMKGEPSNIGPYTVVYSNHANDGKFFSFQLDFYKNGETKKAFTLEPVINKNSQMGDVYEPRIRHLLTRDIYTVVSYGEAAQPNHIEGYTKVSEQEIIPGQSMVAGAYSLVFDSISSNMAAQSMDSIAITARMRLMKEGEEKHIAPVYILKGRETNFIDATLVKEGLLIRFERVSEQLHQIVVGVYQPGKEYIVLKVMAFPWIIVLWSGAVVMFIGFFISMLNRAKKAAQPELPATEENTTPEINPVSSEIETDNA
jgi:cytochrome c-type biogenesis protein CcmF